MSEENQKSFNPREHLIQLKSREGSKDYLPVNWRLVWFREQCPQGTIETEEVVVDLDREVEEDAFAWNAEKRRSEKIVKRARGYARFRAVVTDGKGGRATGTKSENAASFPDYIEKAETGAIGRALAALGYGTQFAPDLDEAHRIVDAPVERSQDEQRPAPQQQQEPRQMSASNTSKSRQNGASEPVAEQQEKKPLSVKEYFAVVYKHALALKQFSVSEKASDQEKIQAFLDFAGPVVGATLVSAGHLTKSRLDDIEAYLNAKDAA